MARWHYDEVDVKVVEYAKPWASKLKARGLKASFAIAGTCQNTGFMHSRAAASFI